MTFNFNKNASLINGMPQMRETLTGWEVPITLQRVIQNVVNGFAVEITKEVTFQGTFQPMSSEELQFKAEGQRSWQWCWIHAKAGTLNLQTADKIIFNGKRYKVMEVKDYSLNGFIEYQVVLDYQQNT